jgi:hypothetical protein
MAGSEGLETLPIHQSWPFESYLGRQTKTPFRFRILRATPIRHSNLLYRKRFHSARSWVFRDIHFASLNASRLSAGHQERAGADQHYCCTVSNAPACVLPPL